jgi:DNA-binding LytR/AlgR family response regulator
MTAVNATALVADDEPLLRDELSSMLHTAWPTLRVVAQARNGREAVALFEQHRPDVCFLDIHMPGLSGVDAASAIGRRAQLVFVTAHDQYALQAFEHGALDYLVKPVDPARLADTVARLQQRLQAATPGPATEALLQQLAAQLQQRPAATPLRWIRASVGAQLRLIEVEQIAYLRSDEKYTLVVWRGDDGQPGEALIRLSLKELLPQLDPNQFAQVHRSVVVNLRAIGHIRRGDHDTADIHLRHHAEVLPVSRSYLHLFRQM